MVAVIIIQTKRSFHREIHPKGADGMTKSVDPDQTAGSSLICAYAVCQDLSVPKYRIIMVNICKQQSSVCLCICIV